MKIEKNSLRLIMLAIAMRMFNLGAVAQEALQQITATPGEIFTIQLAATQPVPGVQQVNLVNAFKVPEGTQPGHYFLVRRKVTGELSLQTSIPDDPGENEVVAVVEVMEEVSPEFLICDSKHENSSPIIEQSERLGASCTFSLLGFEETKDAFGKRVAKTYLAVQVTVRNLSRDFEYLLHDVGLGWNSLSLSSRAGGVLRGVLEKGRIKTPRNQFMRFLEFSGQVLGGITVFPRFTGSFSKGVGVFQGPLVEGFKSFWPDFSIEQLNRLNDLGFDTHKRVVPRAGSLFAVTFIPQQVLLTPYDSQRFRKTGKFATGGLGTVERFSCKIPGRDDQSAHFEDLYKNHFPFFLQCLLRVRLAGAHVQEVQASESQVTLVSAEPSDLPQGFSGNVTFRGSDLTRVSEIAAFGPNANQKLRIAVSDLSYDSSGLSMTASITVPTDHPMQDGSWKAKLRDDEGFGLEGPDLSIGDWGPIDYTIEPETLSAGDDRILVIFSPNVTGIDSITLFQEGTTATIPTVIQSKGPDRVRLEIDISAERKGLWRLRFQGPTNIQVHESAEGVTIQ